MPRQADLHVPKRARILARLSEADDEENGNGSKGINDQIDDLRAEAARMGWTVLEPPVVEDGVSAFKRRRVTLSDGRKVYRVVRPALAKLLDELTSGVADGLLAYDIDRAFRDPQDLEDLIMVVEMSRPRIPVRSLTGSLRLDNDADITMSRIHVVMANKSSKDTGRRVSRAKLRQALNGEYGGGRRPYGFEADGVTPRPSEVAEIVKAGEEILTGVSLKAIVRDLNARGLVTVTGTQWTSDGLRAVLLRARNAGLMVHRGEEVGPAPWDPLVPEDQWRVIVAKLTDPARKTSPGPAPRWLGSGLYQCGVCGSGLRVHTFGYDATRQPTYRCQATGGGHVARTVASLDAAVVDTIVRWMTSQDVSELVLPRTEGVDVAALRMEVMTLRASLDDLGAMYVDRTIDKRQLESGTKRAHVRMEELQRTLEGATATSPLVSLAGALDVRAAWEALPLGSQRRVIEELMTVTVLPIPEGGRGLSPDTLRIEPKKGGS